MEVDNPVEPRNFELFEVPEKSMLPIVKAVGHLHSLGVCHGDVSLSNILLTATNDIRLADFGTVTAHTYLTEEKLCVAYIRPPETTLGSQKRGAAVDAWAVGLVGLALWTRQVPTYLFTVRLQ